MTHNINLLAFFYLSVVEIVCFEITLNSTREQPPTGRRNADCEWIIKYFDICLHAAFKRNLIINRNVWLRCSIFFVCFLVVAHGTHRDCYKIVKHRWKKITDWAGRLCCIRLLLLLLLPDWWVRNFKLIVLHQVWRELSYERLIFAVALMGGLYHRALNLSHRCTYLKTYESAWSYYLRKMIAWDSFKKQHGCSL